MRVRSSCLEIKIANRSREGTEYSSKNKTLGEMWQGGISKIGEIELYIKPHKLPLKSTSGDIQLYTQPTVKEHCTHLGQLHATVEYLNNNRFTISIGEISRFEA